MADIPTTTAPPAGVRIIDSGPPKPPPAPTREIRVSSMTAKAAPSPERPQDRRTATAPTERSSDTMSSADAKNEMRDRLGKLAKPAETTPPVKEDERPGATPDLEAAIGEEGETGEGTTTETPAAAPAIDPKAPKAKVNPWKELKTVRTQLAEKEAEINRLKTSILPEQDSVAMTNKITAIQKRNEELENHIRFVDYQKSDDFNKNYETPYIAAWQKAFANLSEVPVIDPATGTQRAVTESDMWQLVNASLPQAKAIARELFTEEFASDAMSARKEIKDMLIKRNEALEDAKKNGGERIKEMQAKQQAEIKQKAAEISKLWKDVHDEIEKAPEIASLFKPKPVNEGETPDPETKEWNENLSNGYKWVDDCWQKNPLDAKWTPEERRSIVAAQAAMRNCAAAFKPLRLAYRRLEKKCAALEKELGQYAETTPGAGGSIPGGSQPAASDPTASLYNRLKSKAR